MVEKILQHRGQVSQISRKECDSYSFYMELAKAAGTHTGLGLFYRRMAVLPQEAKQLLQVASEKNNGKGYLYSTTLVNLGAIANTGWGPHGLEE